VLSCLSQRDMFYFEINLAPKWILRCVNKTLKDQIYIQYVNKTLKDPLKVIWLIKEIFYLVRLAKVHIYCNFLRFIFQSFMFSLNLSIFQSRRLLGFMGLKGI